MAEPIQTLFGMCTQVGTRNHVLDGGPDPHTWRDSFEGKKEPAQNMPGHVRRLIYLKQLQLSRGQNRHRADTHLGVLVGVHIHDTW